MSGFRGQKPAHLIFFVIFANIRHNFFLSLSRQCRFFAGFLPDFAAKVIPVTLTKKTLSMPRNGDFLAGEPIFYLIYLLIPGPNPAVRHSIFLLFSKLLAEYGFQGSYLLVRQRFDNSLYQLLTITTQAWAKKRLSWFCLQ